ncbi:MAG: hypothetical protein HY646_00300, partial [Acidobacteria bacterium]|nr:hypothetical protein [Acidobacteriota bacterium]
MRAFFMFALTAALLLYGNALQAPFQLDDPQVLEVARQDAWTTRPLGYASFWLSTQAHKLFSDVLPWRTVFYHRLFNIVIHALSATVLFSLALDLTRGQLLAAALAGVFFLVHPVQTQATVYISQRFESLAALFIFTSASAYVKFRRTRSPYWLAVVLLAAAAAG